MSEKASGFGLPLGPFQIHVPAALVLPAAQQMGTALSKLQVAMDSLDPESFEQVAEEARAAGDALNAALAAIESPSVLPAMTRQLLYASLIAQALELRFDVTDFRRESTDAVSAFWWVDGQVVSPAGDTFKRPGTSFSFRLDDEKRAEGALLSACADAFIHTVYAAVPYFPWDRWA